ncbi:Gfo/Idh/MocA family oxidoreductase [Gelidibacter japonicus]|uniref:Gfo/Idh/MocA family protein n=1 Tax=Gelidibacter japonicus TaxID=1962232 RepID=UPI0020202E9C|nr:Gfo/Idh/MocA family oxidoreductase [Gelidibacter japonicus]MCL8006903.1 Gfo/Idh/MocA family oxidoreductase [Gelidibacter japonicus]
MKANKTYKWGMIGCGSVTELKSAPAYYKTEGFELFAVMRRDLAKAEDYAKRHKIPFFYDDADALINHPEIDAIYIATPPDSHEYYALKVAEAGKICCIEKPMAPSYEACLRINTVFEDRKLPLFVAYYRRSLPRFVKIKEWIDQSQIGTIRHIHWHFTKPTNDMDKSKSYNWRTDADIAPGGYFDDLASHGLDLFVYLLGPVKSAKGKAENRLGLYTAKDLVKGQWTHNSGVTGFGSWNFGADQREDVVKIYGNEGNITFSVFGEVPIILERDEETKSLTIKNPEHVQWYHVQNIKAHLSGTTLHPSVGRSAMHTAWIMDQILENKTEVIKN